MISKMKLEHLNVRISEFRVYEIWEVLTPGYYLFIFRKTGANPVEIIIFVIFSVSHSEY